jgi:adenosine deaminase
LNSTEVGYPPSKFQKVFARAQKEGFLTVAHAGEEGPVEYIWEALDLLKVSRIDHGIHSLDDDRLVEELVRRKIPLTVCPLSNLRLNVVDKIEAHPLHKMMQRGLIVTINSDDPAYFGGYLNENYSAVAHAFNLTKEDIYKLANNSFNASFLDEDEKAKLLLKVDEYMKQYK